jgi:hypothetical protein
VVIVSEEEWRRRPKRYATLAELFMAHAGPSGYGDILGNEPIATQDRPLGSDVLGDED